MSRSRKLRLGIGILLAAVLAAFFVIRVVYVNTVKYQITERVVYRPQETFSFHNLQITSSEYGIYSGEELSAMYDDEIKDYVDEQDLLFNLEIENTTGEVQTLDLSSTCIQYDSVSGGGLNPYLFSYFNENASASMTLDANETKTVTMIFPYFECRSASLIFSLYPENVKLLVIDA